MVSESSGSHEIVLIDPKGCRENVIECLGSLKCVTLLLKRPRVKLAEVDYGFMKTH